MVSRFRGQIENGLPTSNSICITPDVLQISCFSLSSCLTFVKGAVTTISIDPRHLKATITFGILSSSSKTLDFLYCSEVFIKKIAVPSYPSLFRFNVID